ncbi:MAG: hypothetical protein ACREQ5_10025 [Candidatus Dormibacteria bacterium]
MTVVVKTEEFNAGMFEEMLPLIRKCWDECTVIKDKTCAFHGDRDFQIEPDFDVYQKLANEGSMVFVTLRAEGKLVGYVEGFLYRAMHHKKVLCGMGDSLYIEPEYRAYILRAIDLFEKEMTRLKAEIIGWPTTREGYLYEVLKARGYIGDDIVMELKLCA